MVYRKLDKKYFIFYFLRNDTFFDPIMDGFIIFI